MSAVQIGPLYVNWSLLTVLVSAAAAYMAVVLVLRRTVWKQSILPDLLVNALLLGIAGWKLSPFLFDPSLVWHAPMKGLLMQGGDVEALIGALAALCYFGYRTFRSGLPLRAVSDALTYGALVFMAVRAVVGGWVYGAPTGLPWGISLNDPQHAYHPINAYELLLAVVLLILIRPGIINLGDGRAAQAFLIYGGAGLFAISLISAGDVALFVLTGAQWLAVLMTAAGLLWFRMCILWEAGQERRGFNMTNQDSKAQQEHERENKQAARTESPEPGTPEYDKRLDGPNRPAE